MGKHRKPSKPNGVRVDDTAHKPSQDASSKPKGNAANGRSKTKSRFICEPRPDWHAATLPDIVLPSTLHTLPPELLQSIQDYADELLNAEASQYDAIHLQKSSDHKFMNTVMTSGTWSDKVSALTLVVQESPLHTRKQFENLLGLASKRSRDNALTALAAIKDMLAQGHVLPRDRKLRYLGKQPGLLAAFQGRHTWTASDTLPQGLAKQHLLCWRYEDWLKRSYFEVLKLLESWLGDAIENARTRSLDFVFELLKERPEQEENLLRLLVNKLGDTNKKIASKASHRILRLEAFHPSMKSVIVNAIESEVLLKPGQSNHAKYYAAITLNQTVLTSSDPETANKLLDVYFSVFVVVLNKSRNQSKTLKKPSDDQTHMGKRKGKSKPQLAEDGPANPEKQLEEKLVAQVLAGIQRAFPYSSQDNGDKLEKHVNTLFSITHSSNFGTSLRALTLLHTITSTYTAVTNSSNLRDRFLRSLYESLLDPRLISSTAKHTMYFNLLYRSLKDDSSMARVKAFVKRLLQICTLHEPSFMVSALYLVNELTTISPSLASMLTQKEAHSDGSDDEEVFYDVPEEPEPPLDGDSPEVDTSQKLPAKHTSHPQYDSRKRDPLHANADLASLWDLSPYLQHYHPSVSLFTEALMPHQRSLKTKRLYKPDPATHTLIHFLDRFAYRNPKAPQDSSSGAPKGLRGHSIMQPALSSSGTTDHYLTTQMKFSEAPVSSEQFWQKRVEEIAPQDVFFHRYFSAVGPSRKAAKDRKRIDPTAGTGEGDDEFDDEVGANEEEIWKALVSSHPDVERDSSDDDDGEDSDEVDEDFKKAMISGSDEEDEDGGVELNLQSDDEELGEELADGSEASPFADDDGREGEEDIFGAESDEESEREIDAGEETKDMQKRKKRKLSSLPTFASADDYAKMIEDGDADQDTA